MLMPWDKAFDLITLGVTAFLLPWFTHKMNQVNNTNSYARIESLVRGWIGVAAKVHPDKTVQQILDECIERLVEEEKLGHLAAESAVANVQLELELPVGINTKLTIGGFFVAKNEVAINRELK